MLSEESTHSFHDMNPITKTVSITVVTIIKKDGVEIARSNNTRAFAPGQIEDVKSHLGVSESPEISYLNTVWTQDVIDSWKALEG